MGDLFYLHEYIAGQPDMSHSCGFVKFCRQTGWMMSKNVNISINVRGLYSHGTAKDGVYALVPEENGLTGAVRLCDVSIVNGFGKTECQVVAENISGSGFDWNDVMGIAIVPDSRASTAAVLWKNENADINDMRYGAAKRRTSTGHTSEAADKAENTVGNKVEVADKANASEDKAGVSVNRVNAEAKKAEVTVNEADATAEKEEKAVVSAEEISLVPLQNKPEILTVSETFEKIDGNFVDAFDDDDFYDCMEVTPEQLQQIFDARRQQPEIDGAFGTMQEKNTLQVAENSFLMHGYFTFRHLLVARVHNDPDALFVGVPGVYNNKERFMASMFNFNNFKRSHRSDCRNPYFGYWYQTI
ncbi:MAG: DUF6128 domain-containing protein [Bacteroides sp.]